MGDFSTLNELRATAVHEHAPPPVHRSGGGNSGIFSPDERADEEALLAALPSGVGGGVRLADDPDTRKFRSDKLSRIFRLQRGTRCFRFTLLFLSVLIVFSGYLQFDLPAITVDQILPKLNIGMAQFSAIFIGYSVSNTIVPLLSGPFFSRMGKWRGVTIIAITITIGVAIVWGGMVANSFPLVVIGRAIYGLGGESVFVGIDILVTKWFHGAEIGFAYGLIQAAGQAGSFTALYSVPELVQRLGSVDHVYLISLGMSCTALLALGIARILEKTAYGRKPIKPATEPSAAKVHDAVLALAVGGHFAADDSTGTKGASLLAHDHESKGATGGGAGGALHAEDDNEPEEVDTDIISAELRGVLSDNLAWANRIPGLFNFLMFLGIGHMFSLKWRFYCVLGGIIAYSSAFYTFLAFGPKWLMTTYDMDEHQAGQTAGIIAIFSMILSPSTGLIMDVYGGQRYVCFGAMLSACMWFAIMGFAHAPPVMCIIFAGMSYSLLPASLYPLLPEFVPEASFTTVYAILNSLINLLVVAGQILGENEASSLAASRGGWSAWSSTAAFHDVGGARALQEHKDVDPSKFNYVFAIFIIITGFGTCVTAPLAIDAWRHGTGGPLQRKHGH